MDKKTRPDDKEGEHNDEAEYIDDATIDEFAHPPSTPEDYLIPDPLFDPELPIDVLNTLASRAHATLHSAIVNLDNRSHEHAEALTMPLIADLLYAVAGYLLQIKGILHYVAAQRHEEIVSRQQRRT